MRNSGSTVDQLRVANIGLVKRFIQAINDSWNIDEMRELVSDDFVFVIPFAPTWFKVRFGTRGDSKRWRSWTACAI